MEDECGAEDQLTVVDVQIVNLHFLGVVFQGVGAILVFLPIGIAARDIGFAIGLEIHIINILVERGGGVAYGGGMHPDVRKSPFFTQCGAMAFAVHCTRRCTAVRCFSQCK